MKQVFKLTDGTTTVDFLTDAARLAVDGYSMSEEFDEDGFIWETIKLINPSSGTTEAQIRAAKKNIDDLLETARRFHAGYMEDTQVWLYCQSEEESPRRAIVIDGKCEIIGTEFDSPMLGVFGLEMMLAVRRGRWESDETVGGIGTTGLNDNGEKWTIGNASGTLPQRISQIRLGTDTGATMYKAWIGIRPLHNGTNFTALWGCENGMGDGIDTDTGAISGAHGGQGMRVYFRSSTIMENRGHIYYDDVANGNWDDLAGRYLILARLAVDAADTECAFKLTLGTGVGEADIGTVYVTSDASIGNSFRLFEMGEVQIPPTGRRGGFDVLPNLMKEIGFGFYAERLSDAGVLYIDYLLLIPSEHMVVFESGYLGGPDHYYANVDPDDVNYAIGRYNTDALANINASFHNWNYPVGGGVLVMAAQADIHSLNHTYNIDLSLVPRWTSYRTT